MHSRNIPIIGPRYWVAMCAASVFGANMGDLYSHSLHLGHDRGLLPLAALFAAILWLERRAQLRSQAYYWGAVVMLRTAATNLADLATHDFALAALGVAAALAAILAMVVLTDRRRDTVGLATTGGRYWLALALAGTVGTALGDGLAEDVGLGLFYGSALTCVVVAAAFFVGSLPAVAAKPHYWLTVAAVRTAGTNVADLLASGSGVGLGLPLSTGLAGVVMIGILVLWRDRRVVPAAGAMAVSSR